MRNPWMSLWLSAANSWAGAVRSFWIAELHRQHTAIAHEMIHQTIDFWSRTRMALTAGDKPKRRGWEQAAIIASLLRPSGRAS
jgi:hypothetical protein